MVVDLNKMNESILSIMEFGIISTFHPQSQNNKYFELKNSWGAGAPLNSNYLLLLLYCSHPYYMNP